MRQPRGGSSNSLSAVHKELIPDVLPIHQLCFHTGRSSSRRRRECCCGSSKQPFCGSRRRCVGGRGGFVCVTCAPKGPWGQQAGGAGLAGRWGWRGRGRGLVGVFGAGAGIVVGVCPGRLHPVRLHGPLALDLPQQQCRRRRTKSHGGREAVAVARGEQTAATPPTRLCDLATRLTPLTQSRTQTGPCGAAAASGHISGEERGCASRHKSHNC